MVVEEDPIPKGTARDSAGGQGAGRRTKQPLTIDLEAQASSPTSASSPDAPASNQAEGRSDSENPSLTSGESGAPSAPKRAPPSVALLAGAGAVGGLIVLALGFGLQATGVLPVPRDVAARTELETVANSLSGLDQRITAIEAANAQAVADRALLDDLSRQVGVVDAFGTSLSDRLLNAEASIASLGESARNGGDADGQGLAAIEERVARLERAPATEGGGASDSAVAPVGSELDSLASTVADLESRLARLTALSGTTTEGDNAARAIAIASLRKAAARGGPFANELSMIGALGVGADQLSVLTPLAEKGAPSREDLAAKFPAVSEAVLAAEQNLQTGDGVIDRVFAYGRGLVKIRPTGPVAGDDATAVVSRMRAAVEAGDLAGALAEWETLPAAGQASSQVWAASARDRLSIDRAVDDLANAVGAAGKSG